MISLRVFHPSYLCTEDILWPVDFPRPWTYTTSENERYHPSILHHLSEFYSISSPVHRLSFCFRFIVDTLCLFHQIKLTSYPRWIYRKSEVLFRYYSCFFWEPNIQSFQWSRFDSIWNQRNCIRSTRNVWVCKGKNLKGKVKIISTRSLYT